MTVACELDDVHKTFRTATAEIPVLRGVALSAAPGDTVAIVGPSGSGKSTLLGCMAGLEAPDRGRVAIAGQDLAALRPGALAAFRGRAMGFVFQSYRLLPALTAEENVRVPLELAGRSDAGARARHWLERVGLGDRRTHRPARLSGGEQQRVALARALAPGPEVVFADEPTGNLDQATGTAMADLLFELPPAHGVTLVYVTHDRVLAARADHCYRLHDGRLHDAAATPT